MLFQWGPRFQLGIPQVDAQHKRLVDLVNKLHDAMMAGKGDQVVDSIVQELIAYTLSHFRDEEALMRQHAYPLAARHHEEHEALTADVKRRLAALATSRSRVTVELPAFLRDWLTRHILGSDKAFATYLQERMAAR
jgi:hemerythrin